MKVAIIGTRGIPAQYGGFETLTEFLTKNLSNKLNITVYCSQKNSQVKKKKHNNATLKYIPLDANGATSILYDIISLFHAAASNETIFIFGTSGCVILPIFRFFYPSKKIIINIDGLEHKRKKWNKPIQKFLKLSEKMAVKYGNKIIADNKTIQKYLLNEYHRNSFFIPYGGDHTINIELSKKVRDKYNISRIYAFKVCRIEPENNVHLILEAFSEISFPLFIVGNWENSCYGQNLKAQYSKFDNIFLLDSIYDQNELDQIRSNCTFYIHGHSAGGTNPSLVEAMYLGLPVIAYDVPYNRETTFNKARYFVSPENLKNIINEIHPQDLSKIGNEMQRMAHSEYTWKKISSKYLKLLEG